MKAIVAVDKDWGIGNKGNLLFRIPEDMKWFKHMTQGGVVLMGRKTYDSLPNKSPLPNRINCVLTRQSTGSAKNVNCYIGNQEFIDNVLGKFDTDDIFVIGGESIYKQYLSKCDTLFITRYDKSFNEKDAYFPEPSINNFSLSETITSGEEYVIEVWERRLEPYLATGSITYGNAGYSINFATDDLKKFYDPYRGEAEVTDWFMRHYAKTINDPLDEISGNWYIYKINDSLYRCQYKMVSHDNVSATLETYTESEDKAKDHNLFIYYQIQSMYNSK